MKVNQWTLGLAAMGVISLASAVQAEEGSVPLMTALSATTISGYVDTSAHWNLGTGNANNPYYTIAGSGPAKSDGFNLNVVQLSIAKPLDESEWAAGYKVDLWMGPDANSLGTASAVSPWGANTTGRDFAIRQAYVALRAPVGNGIDFKVGVFDTIVGYESLEAGNNPNYTRSYGFSLEPTTHTGVLATYRFCDVLSASAGVADTVGPQINGRAFPPKSESYKTYMGSVALTAPESWGTFAGSTLYVGAVNGYSGAGGTGNQTSWYAGATLATPITGLKVGAAYDLLEIYGGNSDAAGTAWNDAWAASLYASYQATEKLSFHARGEWVDYAVMNGKDGNGYALTGTVQYDLWQNVISRLEVRWDHADSGDAFGGSLTGTAAEQAADTKNAVLVAANLIYKF